MEQIQGSSEWLQARCGFVGASKINDVLATVKSGEAAARKNFKMQVVVERLTGVPSSSFCSDAMRWGNDQEPNASAAYEFIAGVDVQQTGFILHPDIGWTGASPDGLISSDGLIEIKCPTTANHVEWMLRGGVPSEHQNQMLWQMEVTGREWCDFASYDPRLPVKLQLFTVRLNRDEERIKTIRSGVVQFLDEVAEMVEKLRERMA